MAKLGFKSPLSGLGLRKTAVQQVSVPAHNRSMPQKKADKVGTSAKPGGVNATNANCATCGAPLPSAHTSVDAHNCPGGNCGGGSNQTY